MVQYGYHKDVVTLSPPPDSVGELARQLIAVRNRLIALAPNVPDTARKSLDALIALPGELLDESVVAMIERGGEGNADDRAARNAWLRWAENYWEAVNGAVGAFDEAGISHPHQAEAVAH